MAPSDEKSVTFCYQNAIKLQQEIHLPARYHREDWAWVIPNSGSVTELTFFFALSIPARIPPAGGVARAREPPLEYGNTLANGSSTTVQVPDTSGTVGDIVFTITGTNPLIVTTTIPASKGAGGKLFGRLKGVNP